MDNWLSQRTGSHGVWAKDINGQGHLSMQGDRGKRQSGAFKSKSDPTFDPVTAALRQMHDQFASEPIPDDFMDLLDRIDERFAAKTRLS